MPREPKDAKGWKNKAWRLFSEYIRRRDSTKDGYAKCITCGVIDNWKNMDAGHAIGGRNNSVLLDERIVHAQCKGCNGPKGGMYEIYVPKMIDKYGRKKWDEMCVNARKPKPMKKTDWQEQAEYFQKKLDDLEADT